MKHAAFGQTEAMKGFKKKLNIPRKQKGFTLTELVVVLAILAVIIYVLTSGLFQSKEDAKVQAVKTQLLNTFPSAITRIVTMYNKCNNTVMTKEKMIERGAPAQTVFQSEWTVTTSGGNTTTVTYPLDLQDTELATGLKGALDGAPNVKSVAGTSAQVVVEYRCN